jgi:hypothetical protein
VELTLPERVRGAETARERARAKRTVLCYKRHTQKLAPRRWWYVIGTALRSKPPAFAPKVYQRI